MDKNEFKVLFLGIMEQDVAKKKKTPLKSRSANVVSKKRKREETKKKSKALTAFSKFIRLGGIGPLIYKNLPENPKLRAAELLKRVREKGFEIEGNYPNASEINAAKEARELKMSIDGIDTSNIIEGGRRRRRRVAVKRDEHFVDSSKISDQESEEEEEEEEEEKEEAEGTAWDSWLQAARADSLSDREWFDLHYKKVDVSASLPSKQLDRCADAQRARSAAVAGAE